MLRVSGNSIPFVRHIFVAFATTLVAVLGPAAVAHPSSFVVKPMIAGSWQLNRELSSNGRSELPGQLATGEQSLPVSTTAFWTIAEENPRNTEMLEATELLEISQHGRQITMNATGSANVVLTRTVYTDGRPSEQRFGFGYGGISRAAWDGNIFVIETETSAGPSVTETYEVSDDDLLYVSVRIENPRWSQPLVVRRVYDRIS
jgi:hypothetical protein